MKKDVLKWHSPSLGSQACAEVYGHDGTPIIFFNHDCTEKSVDNAVLGALSYQLENGLNIICTLSQPDCDRVFDDALSPEARFVEYMRIEKLVIDELIPRIGREHTDHFFIAAGIGNGGYLATNMALKHPDKFGKLISVCGRYDMRPAFDGQKKEDFYYNNPIEFLPHLHDEAILADLNTLDIRLLSHQEDQNAAQHERLNQLLDIKEIEHHADVWRSDAVLNDETYALMLLKHVP